MLQGSLFQPTSLSVGEITRYLRELLDSDEILRDVWVSGEVSNPSYPASGHLYFTLKDQTSALKCVMWKPQVLRLRFTLQAGMALEAHGAISVYEQGGQYQLYVDSVRQVGEGALYQEFVRLKAKLDAEGLFDEERKRPIPAAPAAIGVVTSPSGAALQDILNTLQRRYPLARVVIAPTAVQGDAAPAEIVAALQRLNSEPDLEVILLARGGGSLEDLWAFNDERVVRAVFNSRLPVISGVGHETDFTLADFAADLRAPTPTAAAELATPDREELIARVRQLSRELDDAASARLDYESSQLANLQRGLERLSPLRTIKERQQRVDELGFRSLLAAQGILARAHARYSGMNQLLSSLNPEAVLQRGYAIVRDPVGEIIRSVKQSIPDSHVSIKVSDGEFNARVTGGDQGEGA
jgi:exodeoxyribonuclease VII large subunit